MTVAEAAPRLGGRAFLLVLSAIYLGSRVALHRLGIRLHVDYAFPYFHDLDLLRDRLWETLVYTHAFTPLMNLVVGVAQKAAPEHAPLLYQALFLGLGWGFTLAVGQLARAVGIGPKAALALAALFCSTPAFIYFENFLHYEFPTAALLCFSLLLLRRALLRPQARSWLALFAIGASIAYLRTTFHLVWVAALLGIALLFDWRGRRAIALGALLPLALVVALYAKNLWLFGFFGASSWFGFNLAKVTTERLPRAERERWIADAKLHPVSGLDLYSGVRAYARYLDIERETGVPVLDRRKRANGRPNFNHHAYVEVAQLRLRDDRRYLDARPREYLATVALGYIDYFRPTTRWHPKDPERSPHAHNRERLEPWEDAYNAALHRFPIPPFGLYLVLMPLIAYAIAAALREVWRARGAGCVPEKLVLVMGFYALYVPAVSCLIEIGELARDRFMVEAPMWIAAGWGAYRLSTLSRSRWRAWASK